MDVGSRIIFLLLTFLLVTAKFSQQNENVERRVPFSGGFSGLETPHPTKFAIEGGGILRKAFLGNKHLERVQKLALPDSGSIDYKVIYSSENMTHLRVTRTFTDGSSQPRDCFDLGIGKLNWYAGPEALYHYWPVEKQRFSNYSYLPKEDQHAGVSERYWLNSDGFFIYVEDHTPLFIDQNSKGYENQLCLSAANVLPYNRRAARVEFTYHIGFGTDPRSTHMYVVQNLLGKPTGHPDERMVQHPIWSTWALFKKNINEEVIRRFVGKIIEHGFKNSQICIDDEWETCYGALTFRKEKFPDIKNLTDYLKEQGFRVTLWIHPFINSDCVDIYNEAKLKGYLVVDYDGNSNTKWWNSGDAAHLDFTKAEVRSWFTQRLRLLQAESGVDSFKFDAGETSWIPEDPVLQCEPEHSPNQIVKDYVRTVSEFGPMTEVRTGQSTQDLPIFVRMIDKDTEWGWDNGLITLIPTLLQMNLNGYPFVLPDMIGGNGYSGPPNKELLIRWLQANVFMPTLQISYAPWGYDEEAIELFKKFTALHSEYTPYIMKRFKLAVETGEPVNVPIWWIDPQDKVALGVYDEYLLGDYVLCAPVVTEKTFKRDIYLPKGVWRDGNTGETIVGPIWLMDHPSPLTTLPYFLRENS